MADIDVRRLRAIDGVAPQHKKAGEDEFEFTEGSGGALHTKDVDVLSELESIKQQQQQILQRLDEPIDTQLTGSRVELIFTRAQTLVPSGVNMGVNLVINVSKYKYVFIQFAPGGTAGLNQYKLHIRTLRGDTTSAFRQTTVLDGQSGSNNETDFINVKSLNIAVYVENLTSEDRTFDYIHLFGVRA